VNIAGVHAGIQYLIAPYLHLNLNVYHQPHVKPDVHIQRDSAKPDPDREPVKPKPPLLNQLRIMISKTEGVRPSNFTLGPIFS
jgi:hypothetical protein